MRVEPQLVLFDIDGTLLLTHGAGREATRLAMLDIFGTTSHLDRHEFGGKTDWQTLVELLAAHGYDESAVGEVMPRYEAAIARHMQAIVDEYQVMPCPGAPEAVTALRERGVPLGVVTGNVGMVAPIKLRAAGYDPDWFPVGAFGSEAHSRDDLPPLAHTRAMLHYKRHIDREAVVVVGDTVADIQCARALGAVAVAVCTGFCPREDLAAAGPEYLLDDLTPLLDTLRL